MSLYEECVKRAGGESSLCDECDPFVGSYTTVFGVWDRQDEDQDRSFFSTSLVAALAKSGTCWHCGWVTSVASSIWPSHMRQNAESPDGNLTTLDISCQSISGFKYSLPTPGSPIIERIKLSYSSSCASDSIMFSKSASNPKELSLILKDKLPLMAGNQSPEWLSSERYAGRIRPTMVDELLLKHWKDQCTHDHGTTCDQAFTTHRAPYLRLVDVVERCIVQIPPDNVRWTALSYCWGGPQIHQLQKKNLKEYQMPGALQDKLLPLGIVDAMTIVRVLGERYIWIDSLCIIQDDDKDKLEFLAAMGTIYARAVVTIINAANDKVALGIPGISSPRRTQQVHQMKDFWMVEALDLPHEDGQSYLHGSPWNMRGWTFQEGLLSPRCLIIGRDQVYWQCKTATWCEDSSWENVKGRSIYRHYSGSEVMSRLTDSSEENWMDLYRDILDAYTIRDLSSESDRLSAVQAILDVLSRNDEEGYFWGMPKGHMEMALSWLWSKSRNFRRDCDANFMGAGNQVLSAPFPTWSWLGWHGEVPMPTMNRALLGGRLGLKFYRILGDGIPEALVESPYAGPERDFGKKKYMTYDETYDEIGYPRGLKHSSLNYDMQAVNRDDIPKSIRLSKQAPSVVCFWTSTAVLDMKYEGWNEYEGCPLISMSHGDEKYYGSWRGDDDFKPNGQGKFIVISTERIRMARGGDVTVNLLLVEQDQSGLSYRRRLVTCTPEAAWESFKNRKWELIFLA